MLLKTDWVFKGYEAFTCWPFIVVRPGCASDKALIEHELVHYREQRRVLTLPWLLCYWLSKEFRLKAEVRAYKRQIELGGITLNRAAEMLETYGTGRSYNELIKLLES